MKQKGIVHAEATQTDQPHFKYSFQDPKGFIGGRLLTDKEIETWQQSAFGLGEVWRVCE